MSSSSNPGTKGDPPYVRISDAMNLVDQRVSLVGLITDIGIHKTTKGTDCFCCLRIVDESSPNSGICVNFFAEYFEKLPRVTSPGDIITVVNVTIRSFKLSIEEGINAVFNKYYSSFGLYNGSSNAPYQWSLHFYPTIEGSRFTKRLRNWVISRQPVVDVAASNGCLSLNEIDEELVKEGRPFNLICKVLHICEVKQGEWMLFVWDGTDAPPLRVNTKLEEELESPLPLQLEPSSLPRNVLCEFPTIGTVLRVTTNNHQILSFKSLKVVGNWVQFKNITFEVHHGLWCGILFRTSKFSYLSSEDDLVLQRLRRYKKRAKGRWNRMPLSCVPSPSHITETDHADASLVTLMDVLCYTKVVAKFKCVVRVVATLPGHPSDFRDASGLYRLRLTLEDPTARVHAYLYAEDAEKFFGGYPAIDTMIKMHKMLLGVNETDDDRPRNPPWVQLCLKSYSIDENDMWASRNFRIFGTELRVTV